MAMGSADPWVGVVRRRNPAMEGIVLQFAEGFKLDGAGGVFWRAARPGGRSGRGGVDRRDGCGRRPAGRWGWISRGGGKVLHFAANGLRG